MKKFTVKQNKKKVYIIITGCMIIAVLLFLTGMFKIPYTGFFQFAGVVFMIFVLLLINNYCLGGVQVDIDDNKDDISNFPKLYIYTTRGNHNITRNYVVIPFNRILSIEKTTGIRKAAGFETQIILANFKPDEAYLIKYTESGFSCAVICDFGSDAAEEISHRIKLFSGLHEDDEF